MFVIEARPPRLPVPYETVDLLQEVAAATSASGECQVVGTCRGTDADCRAKAGASGAAYVLTYDAEFDKSVLACTGALKLASRAADEGISFRSPLDSLICPAQDLIDRAKKGAKELCSELVTERRKIATARAAVARPQDVARPAPGGLAITRPAEAAAAGNPFPDWVPWTLVGSGAAAIAAGGVALYYDGHCTGESNCSRTLHTTTLGYSLIGLGALTGGLGVVLWNMTTTPSKVSVSIGPSGMAMAGRF